MKLSSDSEISQKKDQPKKQILFKDIVKKIKECARCHKVLPFDSFFKISKDSSDVRPYCKRCHSELSLIRKNKKKVKVLQELSEMKCERCGVGLEYLPGLQFHHKDPGKKTTSWNKINGYKIEEILRVFRNEDIEVLCCNCHLKEQSHILNQFHDLISNPTILNMPTNEIHSLIMKETSFITKKTKRAGVRQKVKEWIKKKFIMHHLHNNVCVACNEICVENGLSVFEFHHLNNLHDEKTKWQDLDHLNISEIIKILIKEKCVCICSNCHNLIHSNYWEKSEEILSGIINEKELGRTLFKIRKKYGIIHNNISKFIFPKINGGTIDLTHNFRDNWKYHLITIHDHVHLNEVKSFKTNSIIKVLDISSAHINKHIQKYQKKGIIEEHKSNKFCYVFTDFGLEYVRIFKNIELNWIIDLLEIFYFSNSKDHSYFTASELQYNLNMYKPSNILVKFRYMNYIAKSKKSSLSFYFTKIGRNTAKEIEVKYKILAEGIKNPPTYHKTPQSERWKYHLLRIYKYTCISKIDVFTPFQITPILNIARKNVFYNLKKLINCGIVKKRGKGKYEFTKDGLNFINEIKDTLPNSS